MRNLKTAFLRAAARRAQAWADSILNEIESDERKRTAQSPENFSAGGARHLAQLTEESEPPSLSADRQISGGPPAHWIERIRQAAPELLDFFNATQSPLQTTEEAEKLGSKASQQPRSSAQSRAQKNPTSTAPRARPTEAASRGEPTEAFRDDSIRAEASKIDRDLKSSATASKTISTAQRAAKNTEARSTLKESNAIEESKKRFISFNASDESSDESSEKISSRRLIESYEAHPLLQSEPLASSKNPLRDSRLEAPRLSGKPKEKSESSITEIPPQSEAKQETTRQVAREAARAQRERDDASRAESQGGEFQRAEPQKVEPQKSGSLSFFQSSFQSSAESASARRLATKIPDQIDNRWPELMQMDSKNSRDDLLIALDERDRLRRLDDEQRGELWSA